MESYATMFVITPQGSFLSETFPECIAVSIAISRAMQPALPEINFPILILEPLASRDHKMIATDRTTIKQCPSRPSQSTASDQAWDAMRCWMQQCIDRHAACNKTDEHHWHPTRLLDLATSQDCGFIRLVQTAESLVSGPYMTISHRWGSSQPICLYKNNLHKMQGGTALTSLPQVFRDAIIVCHQFSVSLSVDRLFMHYAGCRRQKRLAVRSCKFELHRIFLFLMPNPALRHNEYNRLNLGNVLDI
ncbi:hypothetical protein BST61_g7255 [Cercospora zeina]